MALHIRIQHQEYTDNESQILMKPLPPFAGALACGGSQRWRRSRTSSLPRFRSLPSRSSAVCPSTFFFFTLVTGPRRSLRLTLGDTRVYGPQVRARLVTIAHLCQVVVLKLRAVPVKHSSQFKNSPSGSQRWRRSRTSSLPRFRSLPSRSSAVCPITPLGSILNPIPYGVGLHRVQPPNARAPWVGVRF